MRFDEPKQVVLGLFERMAANPDKDLTWLSIARDNAADMTFGVAGYLGEVLPCILEEYQILLSTTMHGK